MLRLQWLKHAVHSLGLNCDSCHKYLHSPRKDTTLDATPIDTPRTAVS